jgi:hypothetical protein
MEWHRMDLHIHTPASKDYQDPDKTYLDILRKAEAENLDLIAFTDHNTVAGYATMMNQVAEMERWNQDGRLRPDERARLAEYQRLLDKIVVLPGFELTATFGFHILALFAPDTPLRRLEHLLLSLNVPIDKLDAGETEVGATSDVLRAYEMMADAGALVIGAHANSTHGVAMMKYNFGGQTRIAYTQDANLHALEVTDLESNSRRTTTSFFNGSKTQYPRRMHCIQGSDAHRIKGIPNNPGVGERATEVLLPELSFEALKALFLENDFSRTRPYRRTAEPFDHVEAARKQGPTIVQSFHEQWTRQGGRMHAILRDVVAFANTNGGTIYVGVSPNMRQAPKGVEDPQEAIREMRTELESMITPPIEVAMDVLGSGNAGIVRLIVPKGSAIPYVMEGSKIYLRKEAETDLAMRDEIVAVVKRALASAGGASPVTPSTGSAVRRQPRQPQPAQQQPQAQPRTTRSQPVEISMTPTSAAPAEQAPAPQALVAAATESSASLAPSDIAPRTGVEIVESVDRKGVLYHTMRDLRDMGEVHNVTRVSARRLWRYAIALKEKSTFHSDKVTWTSDLGLWHKYLRSGRPHYDLVQKMPDGSQRVYYGVTDDGIVGPWRVVVGLEDESE